MQIVNIDQNLKPLLPLYFSNHPHIIKISKYKGTVHHLNLNLLLYLNHFLNFLTFLRICVKDNDSYKIVVF